MENTYVDPIYMDITLPAGHTFEQTVSSTSNAFIFVIEGDLIVGDSRSPLGYRILGILGEGDRIAVTAVKDQALFPYRLPILKPTLSAHKNRI